MSRSSLRLVAPLLWAAAACTSAPSQVAPPGQSADATASSVSYSGWVETYLATNCATCHATGGTAPDLSTQEGATQNAAEILAAMENGTMPKSGTPPTSAQIQKMLAWFASLPPQQPTSVASTATVAGVDTSTTLGNVAPQAPLVTYANWASGYLAKNCTACHATGGSAKPDLSTFQGAEVQSSQILQAMQSGSMPPSGPAATSAQIQKMQAWIAGGLAPGGTQGATQGATQAGTGATGQIGASTAPLGTGTGTGLATGLATVQSTGTATGQGQVTYASWVQAYLSGSCTMCHNSAGSATPDLSTQAAAAQNAASVLSAMQDGSMPQGGTKATPTQISDMQSWISAGTP